MKRKYIQPITLVENAQVQTEVFIATSITVRDIDNDDVLLDYDGSGDPDDAWVKGYIDLDDE